MKNYNLQLTQKMIFICTIVRGRSYFFGEKKVSFDFAVALYCINAPDIPKNFAK